MKQEIVTSKTFKEYDFDDWFLLGATLLIGIGLIILFVTTYNSIK